MPNPTAGDLHVNQLLSSISIAFMQNPADFVADRIFPNIPSDKQSNLYARYSRADFNRNSMKDRAPSTESAGAGWNVDNTASYFCKPKALHKDIDDQIRSNADLPYNMDRDATLFLSNQALINREVTWATAYFATGIWTGAAVDVTGVSASPAGNTVLQWNDANATPVADVKAYSTRIKLTSTIRPNKLVIGSPVWDKLSEHGTITDRVKYGATPTSPAIITKQAVAALMQLDEIAVMDGVQNTGAESSSTVLNAGESNAFIGGKSALLIYANPTPSLMQPSGGYTFSWTGYLGAGAMGQRIKKFRMEHLNSDRVEIEQAYQQAVICSECGVFMTTIVA